MEDELDVRQRLEPGPEARHRLPHALRDRADAAVRRGVEVKHPVGLTEADRPEHDGLRAVRPSGHARCSLGTAPGRNDLARVSCVIGARCPESRSIRRAGAAICVRAKTLLDSRGLPYEEISLDDDPRFRQTVLEATGGWTVPQILIDGRPIGGYTELWRLDREGCLDELLAA